MPCFILCFDTRSHSWPRIVNTIYFSNSWLTKKTSTCRFSKFEKKAFFRPPSRNYQFSLLPKTMQASLLAKDHILHFRCYVQLGRAKDAQELFHRLSPEARQELEEWRNGRCTKRKMLGFFGPLKLIDNIKHPGK